MWSGATAGLTGIPLIPSFLYPPKGWKPGFLPVLSFTFHFQVLDEQVMGPLRAQPGCPTLFIHPGYPSLRL